ncbi:MAG: hypothetical protein O3A20_08055 [Planctomycetota bacterium]|nr:hypothetical protein [Planctomycetota bacterium]
MTHFPHDLPQHSGAERVEETEQRELLALAEELREACPDPAVDAEFADAVRARMARPWTVWRTIEHSRLARTAATMMVIVVGVAPLVALARMLPWFREDRPPIGFILPRNAPEISDQQVDVPRPLPPAESLLATADATVQRDRLTRAATSWREAGPAAPAVPTVSRPARWESASAEELWQEFVRRCAQPEAEPVPAELAARALRLAWQADEAERLALAPWLWVLGGDPFSLREARASHAWAGAPWLSGR